VNARTEVMYVEDQHVNVLLMRALFERMPHLALRVAVDVRSALSLAPCVRPKLLRLDLRLPDGHGADLLTQLRGFEHLAQVPAIAVSAESQFDAARVGFAEFWRKPIHLQHMRERLDHWLAAAPTDASPPAWRAAHAETPCAVGSSR
jgi:CheY-like chemotaxis protein